MGQCSSSGKQLRYIFGRKPFFERFPEYSSYSTDFAKVHLTHNDLYRLHKEFKKVDKNNDDHIDFEEFLGYLQLDPSKFHHRVYMLMNKRRHKEGISFPDFVITLCLFVRSNRDALEAFAFSLYDADSSGGIETEEMIELCKDVYGEAFSTNRNARRIVEQVEALNNPALKLDPIFTMNKFSKFCDRHPGLLYPAFQIQELFRGSFIGRSFWSHFEERISSIEGLSTALDPADLMILKKLKSVHQIKHGVSQEKQGLQNGATTEGESNVAAKSLNNSLEKDVKEVENFGLFGETGAKSRNPRNRRRASIGSTRELPDVREDRSNVGRRKQLAPLASMKPLDLDLLPKLQAELHQKKKTTTQLPHVQARKGVVERNRKRVARQKIRRRSLGDENYNKQRRRASVGHKPRARRRSSGTVHVSNQQRNEAA